MLIDPCALAAPFTNERIRSFYRGVTTYAPWLWARVYKSTEQQDFSKSRIPLMRKPEKLLSELINQHQPKALVSTYPLYPYFIERSLKDSSYKPPVITVVTDSIEINAAWRKSPSDYWLVTDALTRESLVRQGLPKDRVIDTGFPVHPRFADLSPIQADDPLTPFRVLYFPTAKKPHVRRVSKEILQAAGENTQLTIVLGRNAKKLQNRAKEISALYPGQVTIKGWTQHVPELLNTHHLVVGKAGGATVHESLASICPMLIHHLVPGQEQGNLDLLLQLNGGFLADKPGDISNYIHQMLAHDARLWRQMKHDLAQCARPASAKAVADFILSKI